MELTSEQQNELSKLAKYLNKIKKATSHDGIKMDSLVEEFKNNNSVEYVEKSEKKQPRHQIKPSEKH